MARVQAPSVLFAVSLAISLVYYIALPLSGAMNNGAAFDKGVSRIVALLAPAILAAITYPFVVEWRSFSTSQHSLNITLMSLVAPFIAFWVVMCGTLLVVGE